MIGSFDDVDEQGEISGGNKPVEVFDVSVHLGGIDVVVPAIGLAFARWGLCNGSLVA